jgi:predicted transcriptional regulator
MKVAQGVLVELSVIDNPRRRRDRMLIMAEILEVAVDGALKTQMLYRANLSFAQLNEYLRLLLDLKLLEKVGNNGKTMYKTTSKGARYLQRYKEIRDLLKRERNPDPNNGNSVFLVKRGSQVIYERSPY